MITVVCGAPCAGKSTYVWATREPLDLAIDYDRIATALGSETSHASEGNIRTAARRARGAAIAQALDSTENSWVIHTTPTQEQIDRYVDAGATFVLLDPGEDVCLQRASDDDRPADTKDAIRTWYEDPPSLPAGTVTITEARQDMKITMMSARPPGTARPPETDWCRIEARADTNGTGADIYIFDEIGYWGTTARDFASDIADLDVDRITLHLNSPGGDAWDGVAIANVLRRHRATVDVIVEGLAASAASLIAMAGDHIAMAPSSMLMIHDASGFAWGNADTMRESAAILDKLSSSYADAYAKRAGGTAEEWRERMQAETWYTAEEAVLAGLADEWDESIPAVAHSAFRHVQTRHVPGAVTDGPSPDPGPDQPVVSANPQAGLLALLTTL